MEKEDEVAILLWNFVQLLDSQTERQFWVHLINEKRDISGFIKELRNDPKKFYNYCRMSIPTFDHLLMLTEDKIRGGSTNSRKNIQPDERLLVTLRFLATGERFQYLHYNFRVGATTAGKIVAETCSAIWEVLSPVYLMTEPTLDKWIEIAERFEELWNYPNCCGAIDGKHIIIERPWNCGSALYNYKEFHSIILLAVVDADGNFLIIDVSEAGRNNVAGVFMSSTFGRRLIDHKLNLPKPRLLPGMGTLFPYVFVSDDAYGLTKHMMKPFAHSSCLLKERKNYNYRHARARRIVECAFSMMVKKFCVLEQAMLVNTDLSKIITLACFALHNFVRKGEGKLSDIYEEMMSVEVCDDEVERNRTRAWKTAFKVRDQFVQYFNPPAGSVPWQEKMVM